MFVARAGRDHCGHKQSLAASGAEADLPLSSTAWVGFGRGVCRGDALPGGSVTGKGHGDSRRGFLWDSERELGLMTVLWMLMVLEFGGWSPKPGMPWGLVTSLV